MAETKEVYFDEYCSSCVHEKKQGYEEPCDTCLENPYNWDSHKPVKYEKKE